MFAKIKAVLALAVKAAQKTAISVKNEVAPAAIALAKKTAKFIKLNIVETAHLTYKAFKVVKSLISKRVTLVGIKQAFEALFKKAGELKAKNPLSFKKLAVIASSMCLIAVSLLSALFLNFNAMAFSVITNGQVVGYVADSSEVDAIMAAVSDMLVDKDDEENLSPVEFGFALVSKSAVSKGEELAAAVLGAQDSTHAAVGLYVENQLVTVASSEQVIKEALELRKAEYVTEDTELVSILENIEIKTVYSTDIDKISDTAAKALITDEDKLSLSIQTKNYTTTLKTLSHNTVINNDSSKVVGYNRVSVLGKDGAAERSELITSINGEVVETVLIDETVVEEPVDQIIVKGTSTYGMSTVQKNLASRGISFLWPIAVTSGMYISSRWGDGRNHQGIDITGDYGTDIYASYEGTVSFAGWSGDYGYLVVINHKGGYQTAYAHMSSINVKAGQTVKTGDVIAKCGSTGIATGNHVHFEVRIGGTRVNPAPYIGI